MDPVILRSARRHGVNDADMLHAHRNPVRAFEADDLTMLVGADAAGRLLEVGLVTAEGIEFIVHAMPARAKFLR
jgi:NADPH:quinone reductase-like Zn-dependent oxidoreductase